MDEFEDLPVETLAGERPTGAIGDRLLVGLAALALIGGLLVAGTNLLSGFLPESAANPSASIAASEDSASATPRPSPTERALREVSVIPGPVPEIGELYDETFHTTYWIEALSQLTVHPSPDSVEVINRIRAGEIILGERQPGESDPTAGWLYTYTSAPAGWVRTVDAAGRPRANVYETDRATYPSFVQAVSAGPTGFVVHGTTPFTGWQPEAALTAFSSDGDTWSPVGVESHAWGGWGAAFGPSGWLAANTITTADGRAATWLWESASGSSWSPVGEIEFPHWHQFVSQLVGSGRGYLLSLESGDGTSPSTWFSPDGLTWQESAEPLGTSPSDPSGFAPQPMRIAGSDAGFLAWQTGENMATGTVAAFSRDGRTWTPIEVAADSGVAWLSLGITGEWVVGLGRGVDGGVQAYGASLEATATPIPLERVDDSTFDGSVVRLVVSDGTTAYAFGSDRRDSHDRVWAADQSGWRPVDPPAGGFGQPVNAAAAGHHGVLAVGAEPNGVVADPILWHLRADGTWVRRGSEVFPPAPRPTQEECGSLPDRAVEFVALHGTIAVPCFGDRPMEFIAWSVDCRGCVDDRAGPPDPARWLSDPTRRFFLKPIEDRGGESGYWREAIPSPGVRWREEFVGAWLRITGHYDDPAAKDCRSLPPGMDEMYSPGTLALVNECRQRFVVTRVTVVDGPDS